MTLYCSSRKIARLCVCATEARRWEFKASGKAGSSGREQSLPQGDGYARPAQKVPGERSLLIYDRTSWYWEEGAQHTSDNF